MVKWKRDVIVGVLFEVFAVVAYVQSFSISVGTMADIPAAQPGVYLRMWLIIFAVLALALILVSIIKRDMTKTEPMFHSQVIITLALLLAYIFLMDKIGFFLSTFLFTTALVLDYSKAAGKFKDANDNNKKGIELMKSIAFYVVLSLVVTAATQYVFGTLLKVSLPVWGL